MYDEIEHQEKICQIENCKKKQYAKNLCHKHYQQEYRQKNLIKYTFNTLRNNAKRRKKEFSLTFEEFKQFAFETDYIGKKGKRKDSYSIDRIDNTKGYTLSNIRVVTLSENSLKYTKVLEAYYDEREKKVIAKVIDCWTNSLRRKDFEDCPF